MAGGEARCPKQKGRGRDDFVFFIMKITKFFVSKREIRTFETRNFEFANFRLSKGLSTRKRRTPGHITASNGGFASIKKDRKKKDSTDAAKAANERKRTLFAKMNRLPAISLFTYDHATSYRNFTPGPFGRKFV